MVSYTYDAWGVPTGTTGTTANTLGEINPFRYRGYVYDEETGLYYLRSRYYNPVVLRFINADTYYVPPYNQFCYCTLNPIARIDPEGTDDFWEICWDEISNASLFGPSLLPGIAGMDQGNTADIWHGYGAHKGSMAYETSWINSNSNHTFINATSDSTTPDLRNINQMQMGTTEQKVSIPVCYLVRGKTHGTFLKLLRTRSIRSNALLHTMESTAIWPLTAMWYFGQTPSRDLP